MEESEFITMETIMEEDKEENNYNSPPRSPSFDLGHPNFSCTETPTRRTSTCSIDADNASLSRFRLPDFGSRFVNMILGSNRELSHSTDSVKDAPFNPIGAPFILKSPCMRRKSCAEPSPLAMSDDKATSEQPLLSPYQQDKNSEERDSLIPTEQQIVFQDKPPEFCAIKIPDLSVVEEESSGSSRGPSPVNDLAANHQQSYEANSSQESLSSSQSTNSCTSYSGLLQNEV